ncbi:MAG TPA: hypothetical protein VN578_13440 [Candidatus Binatia bacterium]|jgi:hypothetical protein|nr:hypothetical protein [Candidatus Binatia bacterium]
MKTEFLRLCGRVAVLLSAVAASARSPEVIDSSPLHDKAAYFQRDLLDKHWLDGLYVSIVPATPPGTRLPHTVNEPGNVIHAGVWTGRYLAGVGYQYAVTRDPWARRHGGEILRALRTLQEVTGKPGLPARGYVKGHGPVEGWERNGQDSPQWHQGQGKFSDYRWHGDVSVDNFNAVLYGYAIYYDLAADKAQRRLIAEDVDRLMTHLLENQCRIIDVNGEVTQWGHVGIDPDPARDDYYRKVYAARLNRAKVADETWRPPLRASLMLLPDLLLAHHVTGKARYLEFYQRVVARFKDNPDWLRDTGPFTLERLAKVNHSSEGQAYEALYNLVRYEKDPELLKVYRKWVEELWEMNWMEGNSLFTWMTCALLPNYQAPAKPGLPATGPREIPHADEAIRLAVETLHLYPVDRVLRPVMNSLRTDIERNPFARGEALSARPIPINQRPLDNEYTWKGNPYQMDNWLKPIVVMFQSSCDDPLVAWFCDSTGAVFMTLDGGKDWQDVSAGLRGARVQNIAASSRRTFVVYAQTEQGVFLSRDGGLSWGQAPPGEAVKFPASDFKQWLQVSATLSCRISEAGQLELSRNQGQASVPSMKGWRIPRAASVFVTPNGIVASGPGGSYQSAEGENWTELKLWRENETGAADFLHAYWMGRYYGFIQRNE